MRSCRVERSSKRVPSAFSNSAILRLTVDTGMPSRAAALEKLAASTTRTYRAIAFLSVCIICIMGLRAQPALGRKQGPTAALLHPSPQALLEEDGDDDRHQSQTEQVP